MERNTSLLRQGPFDILIIGGGINGAGIARDAAQRGFKVCLVEKGDFASGTSSKTSKLIHGGLRYLEHGQLGLVRESLQERHTLLRIAPHLVRPQTFLIPVYRTRPRKPLLLKLGLVLYDRLAGDKTIERHRRVPAAEIKDDAVNIFEAGLRRVYRYTDARMNDARLCLENILSAMGHGAVCFNYMKVAQFIQEGPRVAGVRLEDRLDGSRHEIRARITVNAAGPWTGEIASLLPRKREPKLRLTKGVHLVLPRLTQRHALLLSARTDGRFFFCIPWNEYSLVGTTDTDFSGDPEQAKAGAGDIRYLMSEIQRVFPSSGISAKDIISSYAGVRPLAAQPGRTTSGVSREYVIEETSPGLLSVYGGKYTTYRSLAEKTVHTLERMLRVKGKKPCRTGLEALPGAAEMIQADNLAKEFGFSEATCGHLAGTYGSRAVLVARLAKELGATGAVCPNHPVIKAEVVFAFTQEMAFTLEDFLTRRTSIRYSSCRGLDCLDTVADILAELSILTQDEAEEQKTAYRQAVRQDLPEFQTEKISRQIRG